MSFDAETLKPFKELGFIPKRESGQEIIGNCPICGKEGKFYVNTETQQWSCKAGMCGRSGNKFSFIQQWWETKRTEPNYGATDEKWQIFSRDRALPVKRLKNAGIVHYHNKWWIPTFGVNGNLTSLSYTTQSYRIYIVSSFKKSLAGFEVLAADPKSQLPVFLCEGFWDKLAMEELLDSEKEPGIVVSVPGADSTFDDAWVEAFSGKDLYACYDYDVAGSRGVKKAYSKLSPVTHSFSYIKWPETLPEGFDVREYLKADGTFELLKSKMFQEYKDDSEKKSKVEPTRELPLLSSGKRPSFSEVLKTYKKWLHMPQEMVDALKITFAVIYSNQIEGDPVWLHITSPAGSGKTVILNSTRQCSMCHFESTVTPHTLVSGFPGPGGSDPSLVPRLLGKVFVLKDFTEILKMPSQAKDEVYSVLRGAFDGEVKKPFGNGIRRHYKGHFSMISGVTPAIFKESTTTVGERFLIYHMMKGVGFNADKAIADALRNVGGEQAMDKELQAAATSFLEYQLLPEDIPELPKEYTERLVALSQLVSMLRGVIEKNDRRDILFYRPQHEMGTRIAKQLKKLMLGLALLKYPAVIDEEVYNLVMRVALDSCIGFNLDILKAVAANDGINAQDVSDRVGIPITTVRECMESMHMLGVLRKEREANVRFPVALYGLTAVASNFWKKAIPIPNGKHPKVGSLKFSVRRG